MRAKRLSYKEDTRCLKVKSPQMITSYAMMQISKINNFYVLYFHKCCEYSHHTCTELNLEITHSTCVFQLKLQSICRPRKSVIPTSSIVLLRHYLIGSTQVLLPEQHYMKFVCQNFMTGFNTFAQVNEGINFTVFMDVK